jgi:hypothetical protein
MTTIFELKRRTTRDEFIEKIKSDDGFNFLLKHARNTSKFT